MHKLFFALIFLLWSSVAHAGTGCDDPLKPWRLNLDLAEKRGAAELLQGPAREVMHRLGKLPAGPEEWSPEEVVGYIDSAASPLGTEDRLLAKGVVFLSAKNQVSAKDSFARLTAINPGLLAGWCGLALAQGPNPSDAAGVFSTANSKAPHLPEPYNVVAMHRLFVKGNYIEAIETLETAIARVPDPPPFLFFNQAVLIGWEPEFTGHLELMRRDSRKLLEAGEREETLLLAGLTEYLSGDYSTSLRYFETALGKNSLSQNALFGAAEAAFCAGERARAVELGERLLYSTGEGEFRTRVEKRVATYGAEDKR